MPKKEKKVKKVKVKKAAAKKTAVKAAKKKPAPAAKAPTKVAAPKAAASTTTKTKKSAKTAARTAPAVEIPKESGPIVIAEGKTAPEFSLPDTHGKIHHLSKYRGKKVVLYFYPKDDTPGCTAQACDFRDKGSAFYGAGAVILGISPDHQTSHQEFATKYNLSFALLCDVEKNVSALYGAWKQKDNWGQAYWGIERSTFILDEEGKIKKIFRKVQVDGHVEEVLEALTGEPVPHWTSSLN